MSFILDILYFLDFYGIGYFCAKKLTKKTDTSPLDFSLSNKAFLFGLGGAFAGVCLNLFFNRNFHVNFFRWQSFMICFGGFTLMYLITSHTSKNRSVSANETLSQKALSNMQPINNVSAAEETEQPLTRAATEIPINLEHFFVADIDNELDYVFLDEILYQSFNGTGLKIVAIFPFPRYQV